MLMGFFSISRQVIEKIAEMAADEMLLTVESVRPEEKTSRPQIGRRKGMMKRASLLSLGHAIEIAKKEASQLTGLKVSSVVGARRDEGSGSWEVDMELLERRAIPDSMDLLGIYDVRLDDNGEVVGIERKEHRRRGDVREK